MESRDKFKEGAETIAFATHPPCVALLPGPASHPALSHRGPDGMPRRAR